ncbi:MAG: Chromosomal replication initiator protein DnaA [uncultured Thermomicrobiales bacterium]|uniref:Chromosomal replication initiator protein DnaA n=1 Tax=uncultured Thermomicrobiales bacterium TaxID=1645740 RepID=A0A6J4VBA7_9BACT|nr:MAG: Chromosomal replication initiator protein DnaA [uncultured Thermomicrobiales bacterium]
MQPPQLWQAVLNDLKDGGVTANVYRNYLSSTVMVSLEDDVATIAASNTVNANTLQMRWAKNVEKSLSDYVGRPVTAKFIVMTRSIEAQIRGQNGDTAGDGTDDATVTEPTAPSPPADRATRGGSTAPTPRRTPARPVRGADSRSRPAPSLPTVADRAPQRHQATLSAAPSHGLNPRYTYETYVVGGSNRFAHAASLAVADRPGEKYNPFYVYGGVGLGKTHLIQSIGFKALAANPELVVRYVSSERFTNDLINALRARTDMEEFRARYRLIDILMIDDIQFIAGKEATMEEFFHTFNALREGGKQVIITSDKPPKAIGGLEERLRSRFEGGLMADVQAPDYEMRMAILRTKSEELGITVPGDVAEYIAGKDQTNTRELEGALNKILALAELTSRPVSLDLAMESLTDSAMTSRRPRLNPAAILELVAGHYGVTVAAIQGKSRKQDIMVPRQVAMYLIRNETTASLVEIGGILGGRDHTTIMHGIGKIEKDLASDSGLRSQLMSIRELLFSAGK